MIESICIKNVATYNSSGIYINGLKKMAICILRWDFYKSHLILLTQQILNLQSKVETI